MIAQKDFSGRFASSKRQQGILNCHFERSENFLQWHAKLKTIHLACETEVTICFSYEDSNTLCPNSL